MNPPAAGRVVALDLGTRRIGVAVTDSARSVALAREAFRRTGDAVRDRRLLAELVVEAEATVVVVGLPLSLDGSRGPAARAAADEAALLADALAALAGDGAPPVELFDERLTTVSAAGELAAAGRGSRERRALVDSAAAAVLLEAWLDGRRSTGTAGGH